MKTTAIILFVLTYILLLSFPKIRSYIALASAACFVIFKILPISDVFFFSRLECYHDDCRYHGCRRFVY